MRPLSVSIGLYRSIGLPPSAPIKPIGLSVSIGLTPRGYARLDIIVYRSARGGSAPLGRGVGLRSPPVVGLLCSTWLILCDNRLAFLISFFISFIFLSKSADL